MADIPPPVPEGRQLIQRYGNGGFFVGGVQHTGSVIVLPHRSAAWPVARYPDISAESLGDVFAAADAIEVLLIGCGPLMEMPDPALRAALRQAGIVPEFMDTGAACRTFNVLLAEDRAVAAALIAVD